MTPNAFLEGETRWGQLETTLEITRHKKLSAIHVFIKEYINKTTGQL